MSIKLLTPPYNYAVCKMEERNYPGVVMQGDSLHSLILLLETALKELNAKSDPSVEDPETVVFDLAYEIENLGSVQRLYEKTCAESGYDLPYVKPAK